MAGAAGLVAVAAGAAACANGPAGSTGPTAGSDTGAGTDPYAALEHVHAVQFATSAAGSTGPAAAAAASGSTILLATHTGLYALTERAPSTASRSATATSATASGEVDTAGAGTARLRRIGPQVDLMGFTLAADGTYLASGHPGPGAGLPAPLGLAASTDDGRSWQVLSRGGESDFHTLSVSRRGVIAYDGTLRFSPDRHAWQERALPSPPRVLDSHWDTGHILATTETGLLHSTDDARTWTTLRPPALLSDVAWAGPTSIVGVTTEQVLVVSTDTGRTWRTGPGPVAPPPGVERLDPLAALTARAAPTASPGATAAPEVILVFGSMPVRTHDLGATTQRLT